MNRSSRRKTKSPYTTDVLDRTISNVYNESFATSIANGSLIDESAIYVALQNNRTNAERNIYAPIATDKESPVRGVVQFDLKHATSGIGSKDTVIQAVLFLKVKDVSPVWPGYNIDVCKIHGISIGADVTWTTSNGGKEWSGGLIPQIGVGYSLSQTTDTPFSVNGFYPLYLTKEGAVRKSPTPREARTTSERERGLVGYHEHTFDGTTYYMPNGLDVTGNQYHGNYTNSTVTRYGYMEFKTREQARRQSEILGCSGFHTIERNEVTIYKPCNSPAALQNSLENRFNSNSIEPRVTIDSSFSPIQTTKPPGDPIPTSDNKEVSVTQNKITVNGLEVNDTDTSDSGNEVVDTRSISFTSGGGRIQKDTRGNEIKISKLIQRNVRKDQILMFDVTSLVTDALGDNNTHLPLLLKGSHAGKRYTESRSNASVGPQDQYISFYSYKSGGDSTVYKGIFNTTRNEVTGTMTVDLYTSDSAGSTPDSTGAYIMRPTAGTSTKSFNDFFDTVSAGDTITFQSGTVNINATTKVNIANTTLTVEGYNKDYIQFQNNPIAGFSAGTYTGISIKMNKTTSVNELELISSSNGNPTPPFKAYEPFTISYHGDSSGSNGSTIFTPTSIKRRDGNVVVTVKETVTSEQHVDHSGGLQFANIANGPRLKIYYRTRRN